MCLHDTAAPVNDDHNAKDFARGHGAELMLHIEPATTWSSSLTSTSRPLGIDSWEIEDTSLQSEGSSTLRLVLIDLSDDTVLSDTSIEVSAFLSSDTVLHAVAPTGNTAVQGPGMNAPQNLSVHTVPAGTDRYTLARSLSNAGVTLPQWGFETGAEPLLNSPEDLRLFTSREDLDDFSRIGEHTFFLFDAIVYDAYGDGNHTYDYTYGQYLAEGFEGRLATSAMERQTYNAMRNILSSPEAKTELEERFMELFYKTYIGDRVAEAVAPLLF